MKAWEIYERKLEKDKIQGNETLFHTANGYLSVRGSFEEGIGKGIPSTRGCYINGFYEQYPIQYNRKNPADPDFTETIINLTDAQTIELWLDDEKFSLFDGTVLGYERTLNMRDGVVTRTVDWESPHKKRVKLTIQRFVSFEQRELFIIHYVIESVNFTGKIRLSSTVSNTNQVVSIPYDASGKIDLRVGNAAKVCMDTEKVFKEDNIGYVLSKTKKSNLHLACSVAHHLSKQGKHELFIREREVVFDYEVSVRPKEVVEFDKYAVYTESRRHKDVLNDNKKVMQQVIKNGFSHYARLQKKYLDKFWQYADVLIEGDPSNQAALRYSMYQLLQSAGTDGITNIGAKGLSGTGYEGHYYWDTEIYMVPFFLFTHPQFAKKLLLFRYNTLPAAKKRAKEMCHPKGALFPWRTMTGSECAQYYPLGSAKYHINPDIAYAVMQYYQVTEDLDFLADFGAEIILETARVMYDAGNFCADGTFVLNIVTGPDEYSVLINNNYYTNLMTKFHFTACKQVWDLLKKKKPQEFAKLKKKIQFQESEIKEFLLAAKNMKLPFDKRLQICAEDDSFLTKKRWDFKKTPKQNYPLFIHYPPLFLNRFQISGQADTTLAHMLREEETTFDIMKNSYHYYEKITTHDSSLSHSIFSIMASRIKDRKKAFDYFQQTARLDLDDILHNTYYGLHTACLGGTWMCCTYGFAGLRIIKDHLHLRPLLPKKWETLEFTLYFKGRRLLVAISHEEMSVKLLEGKPITIYVNDKPKKISYEEVYDNKKLA